MAPSVTPTQSDIQVAMRTFLSEILPDEVPIIQGQTNRTPEPDEDDFVVFTPINRKRLAWNVDTYFDVVFQGSIAGDVLTVASVVMGSLHVGSIIFGVGIEDGTEITELGTGTGGVGTYTVNNSQTVASEKMSAGEQAFTQETEVTMRLDVHGPNGSDYVQIISTLFFDSYAAERFSRINAAIAPLYCSEPQQVPFVNAEQQYEDRWTIELALQANQTTRLPQQFADVIAIDLINVDAEYPT